MKQIAVLLKYFVSQRTIHVPTSIKMLMLKLSLEFIHIYLAQLLAIMKVLGLMENMRKLILTDSKSPL